MSEGNPENPAVEMVRHSNALTLIFQGGQQRSFRVGGPLLDDIGRLEAVRAPYYGMERHRTQYTHLEAIFKDTEARCCFGRTTSLTHQGFASALALLRNQAQRTVDERGPA